MEKLDELITQHHSDRSHLKDRASMMADDHWLDGRGWVGPTPTGQNADAILATIKDQFVFKNVLAEVCRRHRDAVLGREPSWGFTPKRPLKEDETPSAEEQALIDEAEAALTVWFDAQDVLGTLQDAMMALLWSKVKGKQMTVSPVRVFIPAKATTLDDEGNRIVPREELAEVVKRIKVGALNPLKGGLVRDADGEPELGYYIYQEDDKTRIEVVAPVEVFQKYDAKLKSNHEPGTTVIQIRQDGEVIEEAGYQINGRLLMEEMTRREPIINDAMISQQKLMNMAYTMLGRNVVLGGFLERIILNAQVPGTWHNEKGEEDPEGEIFKPAKLQVGAGSTNFFTGMPQYDETGKLVGYATPSVVYRDPVPVDTFKNTIEAARQSLYEEAQQLHVLISGDATSSGKSRVQATNDFVGSLLVSASSLERTVRWLLETVLELASFFAGQPNRFQALRAEVNAHLSAVQPEPEEIRSVIEQYQANLLSQSTAMSKNGVEDVDSEISRINQEIDDGMRPPPVVPGELDLKDDPADSEDDNEGNEE